VSYVPLEADLLFQTRLANLLAGARIVGRRMITFGGAAYASEIALPSGFQTAADPEWTQGGTPLFRAVRGDAAGLFDGQRPFPRAHVLRGTSGSSLFAAAQAGEAGAGGWREDDAATGLTVVVRDEQQGADRELALTHRMIDLHRRLRLERGALAIERARAFYERPSTTRDQQSVYLTMAVLLEHDGWETREDQTEEDDAAPPKTGAGI